MKDKILEEYMNKKLNLDYLHYIHENNNKILSQDKILEPYYSFKYVKKLTRKKISNE